MSSFSPYSKEEQLKGHQKEKNTQKYKNKRYPAKKKKVKVNKNIDIYHEKIIPDWKKRGEFSKGTREAIKQIWGEYCFICGSPHVQLHHVFEKGFGKGGRGVKTNGIPLCGKHHNESPYGIHFDRQLYERITDMFIEMFGNDFYKDEFDLWMEGKISSPTKEQWENYFRPYLERVITRVDG